MQFLPIIIIIRIILDEIPQRLNFHTHSAMNIAKFFCETPHIIIKQSAYLNTKLTYSSLAVIGGGGGAAPSRHILAIISS